MDRWEQIEKLFERASDLPAEKRPQFLDLHCKDDAELRREVESLLASDEKAQEFLESHVLPSDPKSFVEEMDDPWLDQRLGAYRIERRLGRGGMGQVYLASRADGAFQQKVAIKIVKRGMDTESVLRRFRAERQALAQLQHPGIARLLDGGSTHDGLPYLVMEFVDGKPLHQFCDEKRMRIAQRIRIFRQVCLAVDAAHRAQIVHRDLKPGNILVTAEGAPKLLDFGVAKLLDPDVVDFTLPRTIEGQSFLTPEYASPEQIRGEPVTLASDIFSLGVILYELLTGQRPDRARLEKPSEAMARPKTDDTTSTTSWQRGAEPDRLREMLRGDLEIVVMKALHPEPARRYAGARELAEDLRRYQENLPILARKDSLGYRTQKLIQRRRREILTTTFVMTLGIAGWFSVRHYAAVAEERRIEIERLQQGSIETEMSDRLGTNPSPGSQDENSALAVRSRQAMALFTAASADSKAGKMAQAKEKLLHIVVMISLGVDESVFSRSAQLLCHYRLATMQKDAGETEQCEDNFTKAEALFEKELSASPENPSLRQLGRGLFEQLESLARKKGEAKRAQTYAAKARSL